MDFSCRVFLPISLVIENGTDQPGVMRISMWTVSPFTDLHLTSQPSMAGSALSSANLKPTFHGLQLLVRRSATHCERHRLGLSWEAMVVSVDQLDQHLVLAGGHSG